MTDELFKRKPTVDMSGEFRYILQNSAASILVYNGDMDEICNFMAAEKFVENVAKGLGWEVSCADIISEV